MPVGLVAWTINGVNSAPVSCVCVWARTPQNVSQGLALSYGKRRVARGQAAWPDGTAAGAR